MSTPSGADHSLNQPSPDQLPRRRSRGELLDQIYVEGARRRRRRRTGGLGLSVAALAVLAATVFTANLPRSTPQHVASRGQTAPTFPGTSTSLLVPTTATTAPGAAATTVFAVPTTAPGPTVRPTTTVPTAPSTTVGGGPTTTSPTATTDPTTTAVPACRNSSDSACGPFRWDPEPQADSPLVIDVTAAPRSGTPRAFDFAMVFTDPDAPVPDGCRTIAFGDGESASVGGAAGCPVASCIAAFGPWTPPTPQPGRSEGSASHTFVQAGTYEVRVTAQSRNSLCHDPYASYGDKTISVVVT